MVCSLGRRRPTGAREEYVQLILERVSRSQTHVWLVESAPLSPNQGDSSKRNLRAVLSRELSVSRSSCPPIGRFGGDGYRVNIQFVNAGKGVLNFLVGRRLRIPNVKMSLAPSHLKLSTPYEPVLSQKATHEDLYPMMCVGGGPSRRCLNWRGYRTPPYVHGAVKQIQPGMMEVVSLQRPDRGNQGL